MPISLVYQSLDDAFGYSLTQVLIPLVEIPDPDLIEQLINKETNVYRPELSFSFHADRFEQAQIALRNDMVVPILDIKCNCFDIQMVLSVIIACFVDHKLQDTIQCICVFDYIGGEAIFEEFLKRCEREKIPVQVTYLPSKGQR